MDVRILSVAAVQLDWYEMKVSYEIVSNVAGLLGLCAYSGATNLQISSLINE